jgi:ADP-ribosyl-[dinitrogen reductase] hydrolase
VPHIAPTLLQVRHALTFPGGGAHGVGPGQFTDDGELALCLARGLATAPPPAFPASAVAAQYAAWLAGPPGPFDVGERQRLPCQQWRCK